MRKWNILIYSLTSTKSTTESLHNSPLFSLKHMLGNMMVLFTLQRCFYSYEQRLMVWIKIDICTVGFKYQT